MKWLDGTTLALYAVPSTLLVGVLFSTLLAVALAGHEFYARTTVGSQVLILVLTAAAYGVLMAGTCRTLAITLLAFDCVVALWWMACSEPRYAIARLMLGVVTATGVMIAGLENVTVQPEAMSPNVLLVLATWLRLGLYPLFESGATVHPLPSMRLVWTMLHLAVGLYAAQWGALPWIAWPALMTALLHGTLAWVESGRERSLVHAAFASSGTVLAVVALGGQGTIWQSASFVIMLAWLVLILIPTSLGSPFSSVLQGIGYLPPVMATLSLCSLLVIGSPSQGGIFDIFWRNGGPTATALLVVTQGGALSALYRFWQGALEVSLVPRVPSRWRAAGIGVAVVALTSLYPSMWLSIPSISISTATWVGLFGSALWAISLGYGRKGLQLLGDQGEQRFAMWLRLTWLLRASQRLFEVGSGWLLRARAVIEGEHYLAWALLILACLGLILTVYPDVLVR